MVIEMRQADLPREGIMARHRFRLPAGCRVNRLVRAARGIATLVAFCVVAGSAGAAFFPERDITFIIPNQVGGGFDAYVRAISPAMEKYLPNKVNVVPLNVPAGGGAKGVSQLYRARPDGYTIGILNIPGLFVLQERGGGYDLAKFTWLAGLGKDPYGLAVPWNSPVKSVADLQALSKTRPVKFTTTGPDGTAYGVTLIATELLGIRLQLITGYRGSSEYVAAAVRGDGDAVITNLPILARFEAGRSLRLIATFTTGGTRRDVPDAAVLGEPQLADIMVERMVAAPPNLPAEVKKILVEAIDKAVNDPAVAALSEKSGMGLALQSPDEVAADIRNQANFFTKWKKYLAPN
jgi:tripartite-type tricarboxylate transporter receptor subunit TctC